MAPLRRQTRGMRPASNGRSSRRRSRRISKRRQWWTRKPTTTPLARRWPLSEHTAGLAHHFNDLEQQHEAGTLGMWVFLVTEILFFGGLFAAYTIYRGMYPEAFAAASHEADLLLGTINTAILIGSSLTMAMAVYHAQQGNRKAIIVFLVFTMVLGVAFLGIKSF